MSEKRPGTPQTGRSSVTALATSDRTAYTEPGRSNTLSGNPPQPELRPKPPRAAYIVQEAPMTDAGFNGVGRPKDDESRRRKGVFLTLMAEGMDAVTARKKAGIHPDRALRIVTETDFLGIVQAIRDGADTEAQAA